VDYEFVNHNMRNQSFLVFKRPNFIRPRQLKGCGEALSLNPRQRLKLEYPSFNFEITETG
jgi:hypothetical protein